MRMLRKALFALVLQFTCQLPHMVIKLRSASQDSFIAFSVPAFFCQATGRHANRLMTICSYRYIHMYLRVRKKVKG